MDQKRDAEAPDEAQRVPDEDALDRIEPEDEQDVERAWEEDDPGAGEAPTG